MASRMKVLISRNSHRAFGGAELSALDQAAVLKGFGHTPIVLSHTKKLRDDVRKRGIEAHYSLWAQKYTGVFRYVHFWLVFPLMFIQYMYHSKMINPDIINPHSREDQIVFTLLKWWHGKPVIWKDPGDLRFQVGLKRINPFGMLYEAMFKKAIAKADHIYVLNQHDFELLSEYKNSDQLSIAPSSMLFSNYNLEAPSLIKHKKLVIGAVARLVPEKGISHLIEAARMLQDYSDSIEFWIVGDGTQREELEKQASELDNVVFFGQRHDTSNFYRSFDIFVQPAEWEAWGRTIKEAMYFSLPIVGSKVGGIEAQIEDGKTGLFFEPKNAQDLADKLRKLIDEQSLRTQLAVNAYSRAIEVGDFKTIMEQNIIPIYQRYLPNE